MINDLNVSVSKVFIWSTSTLDGATSTIILGNIFKNMEYQHAFFGDFENQYKNWSEDHLENYDKVFVVGMSLTQSLINKIDDPRVVFISNKKENLNVFDSSMISEDCSSCSKLIYKKFKEKVKFTVPLKQLIAYIDDYNGNTLKHEESSYLNAVYRKSGYKKFSTFVNRFWNGFDGFTNGELKLAESFFKEIDRECEGLDLFKGEFKKWKVILTFSKCPVTEIANKLLDNYETDVIIVVNTDSKYVSFRRKQVSDVDLKFMAEHLCDGGGTESSSGGTLTKKFLEFSEQLTEYKS